MVKTDETTDTTANGNGKKKLSATQKRALFADADKAYSEFQKALEAAEAKKSAVSDAFEAIHENLGDGPFDYNGEIFNVGKKTPSTGPNAGKTVYFKKKRREFSVTKI